MSSNLRVSVIMPSFNHARFIRAAIDSVLGQDYDLISLLVMDGGSTDGTLDILRSYGERISFVSQKDRGQSDAINQGLRRAGGDIACWLNSDDVFTPHAIRTAVEAFERHPDVSFVYGRGWNTNESGAIIADAGVLPFDLWRLIHQRNFIQQPSCFFRRSLLERVGFVDEMLHYVMDWELWIRFAACKGLYIEDYLSCNRLYGDNKTQSGQWRRWREIRDMIRKYTTAWWPSTLTLYCLEAMIQSVRAQPWNRNFEVALARLFSWGMKRNMSGRYADGGIERVFRFSVFRSSEPPQVVTVCFTPLSRFDTSRIGREPIDIRWTSTTGDRGSLSLAENGRVQEFKLVLRSRVECPIIHFRCRASHRGQLVEAGAGLPQRRIVGFLDDVDGADARPAQSAQILDTREPGEHTGATRERMTSIWVS